MKSMINDLKKPSAYPDFFNEVKYIQTHISNVFIGDEFVYKIKKPVNLGFLDFSTLKKRKYYSILFLTSFLYKAFNKNYIFLNIAFIKVVENKNMLLIFL